jgi:NAD(P)-dependent dehydrogenase (short-subunit alcohol dehydrogenase family)
MRTHEPRPARTGETVLVTGASSGIGRDAALHLNGLGYRTVAGVRRDADGERLVADATFPDLLRPVILDVTDADQVAAAAATVDRLVGARGLDAFFSNAGIAAFDGDTSCEGCPIETQERVMAINHFGAVRVTQAVLPAVRRARGRIVVNTALMARLALPYNAGYAASKSALEAWMETLRREVRAHGVRVVMIEAAAIASSLAGRQDLDAVPSTGPYGEQHAFLASSFERMADEADDPACQPRRFSERVVEAIQVTHPRTRYVVGGGSRPLNVVAHLPAPVQDRMMSALVKRSAPSS